MLARIKRLVSPTNPLRLAWHFLWNLAATVWYRFPSKKITVIGVTGTNGKTTTANLLARILEESGKKVALASTINFQIGKKKWENLTKITSLGRGKIHKFLREAVEAKCDVAILEVSSHALIQHRLWGVDFDGGILTNLTQDHLDFHETLENYRKAKELLFWNLAKNKKESKIAILPQEDESLKYFLQIPEIGITTFGVKEGEIHARNLRVREASQKFEVVSLSQNFEVETKLMGNFNIANILASIAFALNLKIPSQTIQKALKKIQPIEGRCEVVGKFPLRVVVDFAHTPDALEKLIRTFRASTSGKIWLVFGATGEREREKRSVMGGIAHKLVDEIVLTNDDTFGEDAKQIIEEVKQGIPRTEGEGFLVEEERKQAIAFAIENASEEDTILLAGKGCEKFQVLGNQKIPWNEKEIARKILERRFGKKVRKTRKKR